MSAVQGALEELTGVSSANVDLAANQVTVSYDDSQVTVEQMKEAIEDAGYDVE